MFAMRVIMNGGEKKQLFPIQVKFNTGFSFLNNIFLICLKFKNVKKEKLKT